MYVNRAFYNNSTSVLSIILMPFTKVKLLKANFKLGYKIV
jgi:hypothetical protein